MNRALPYFLISLIMLSCSGDVDTAESSNTLEQQVEDVYIVDASTGDTIETGKPLPFNTSKESFPRGNRVLQHTGAKIVGEKVDLLKSDGVLTNVDQRLYIPDSSANLTHTVSDSTPPKEIIIQPIITTAREPELLHVLPSIYRDNFQFDIRYVSTDQGIPSNQINDIAKDQDGFMWFATSKGLVRYDGNYIKVYNHLSGLPEDNITCLAISQKGNLWFGTSKSGYVKFDGNQFYNYPIDSIAFGRELTYITFDHNNEMWSTIRFGGFVRYDHDTFYAYQWDQGVEVHRPTTSVRVDKNNTKWITGFGIGLYSVDENLEFRKYNTKYANSLSGYINKVGFDKEGNVITAHWGNVFAMFKGDSVYKYKIDSLPLGNMLQDLAIDSKGNVWFASYGAGVFKCNLESKAVDYFGTDQGLSSDLATNIFIDENDLVWVGTEDKGVQIINQNSFSTISHYSGLENDLIYEICENPKGVYHLATNHGFAKMDSSGIYRYLRLEDGYKKRLDQSIPDIITDNQGNLWVTALNAGTTRIMSDGSFVRFSHSHGAQYNPTGLDTSSDGHVWLVGMNYGLTQMYDTTLINYVFEDGFYYQQSSDILITDDDQIWVGSDWMGACQIVGDEITYYTNKEGLCSNQINHIGEDVTGRIWLCTNKGLNYVEQGEIKELKTNQFKLGTDFKSIIQDKENRYWIATDNNLVCLVPRVAPQETFNLNDFIVHVFDEGNGIGNASFLGNSIFIDSENRLMIGSYGGLVIRDLDEISFDDEKPEVYLETIGINGKHIDYRSCLAFGSIDSLEGSENIKYKAVENFKNFPNYLELPYHLNHLTFEFSGLNWDDPHHLEFYYYLEGYEENWNKSKRNNIADYRNLSYGEYEFHLKAVSRDGRESDEYIYSLKINRPWWHTWWARVLFVLIFILIIGGLIKWRTIKLKKRQKILEEEIDQATEKIRIQKEQVEAQKEEMEKAHDELNAKNREILDSIQYAKRIQDAIMPPIGVFKEHLKNSFVYYKPKDIVAGDFYWMEVTEDNILFAACDCTGHGVPGAMVSVICNNSLNRSVREYGLREPGEILDKTKEIVVDEFDKAEEDVKDGMDIALCSLNIPTRTLKFAGANNPLWIIRDGELIEIKGNKIPIGKSERQELFTTHKMDVYKNDTVYIFTDGFADQFGGEKGKKMKVANFKKMLMSIQDLSMPEQIAKIEKMFEEWKGEFEQLDDVCLIGIRI